MRNKERHLRALYRLFTLLFCLIWANGLTAADPPHDSTKAVGCFSCHDVGSTNPMLLPDHPRPGNPNGIDDTLINNTCWGCHVDADPPVYVETHSSVMGTAKFGVMWTVECSVCHNQHTQEQNNLYSTTYGKFIRSRINLGRIKLYDLDENPITDPEKAGIRDVIFTGKADFADGDTTYNGICEVCHTRTNYHRNSSAGNHTHYPGQDCRTCHTHANGFVHGGGGGSGSGCIECHGHDVGFEYETGKFSQGKGTFKSHSAHTEHDPPDDVNGPNIGCDGCHDIDNIPFFKSGSDGNGDNLFNLEETIVCNPCHNDATGIATGSPVLKPPPVWNTTSLDCTGCHQIGPAYTSGSPKANSHAAHAGFGCETCHTSTTTDGVSINNLAVHADGFYTLQSGAGITFSYTFDADGGTCTNISCHGNQSATWGSTVGCDGCHGYPPMPGDGKDINNKFDGGKGVHVTSWDFGDIGGHIINPATLVPSADKYGDTATGYNECYKCHKNGTHADGTVDVMIEDGPWSTWTIKGPYERWEGFGMWGGPADYMGVPGDITTPKTCSNVACHFGNETPRWSCPGGE